MPVTIWARFARSDINQSIVPSLAVSLDSALRRSVKSATMTGVTRRLASDTSSQDFLNIKRPYHRQNLNAAENQSGRIPGPALAGRPGMLTIFTPSSHWRARLTVDPVALGSNEERNDIGNLFGRAKPLQRRHLGNPVDQLRRLAVHDHVGRGRSGRHGVDGDGAAPSRCRSPSSISAHGYWARCSRSLPSCRRSRARPSA